MKRVIKQIPNFFTLLNLLAGSVAIMFSFEKKLEYACYLIFAAMIFDFLDGFLAKLLKATSKVGKELDSLADVVSFGLAPSIFLFHLVKLVYVKNGKFGSLLSPGFTDYIFLGSGFLIVIFAAIRLARFNADTEQKNSFRGLPTPAAAMLISSLPLITFYHEQHFAADIILNEYFILITAFVISILFIVPVKLISLKLADYSLKSSFFEYALLLLSVILLILLKIIALPVIFVAYILFSIIKFALKKEN